jgi:hypothetical protein
MPQLGQEFTQRYERWAGGDSENAVLSVLVEASVNLVPGDAIAKDRVGLGEGPITRVVV